MTITIIFLYIMHVRWRKKWITSSNIAFNGLPLRTFRKDSWMTLLSKPVKAEATTAHTNPSMNFPVDTSPLELDSAESDSGTRRTEEIVRRTRELIISGVNFWEFMKKARNAVNANWVALISAYVDAEIYSKLTEIEVLLKATIMPRRRAGFGF